MTRRRPSRWDVARSAVIGVVLALSVMASMSTPLWLIPLAPFAVVGAILVLRRPANPIGWILIGLICAASFAFAPIGSTPAAFSDGTASLQVQVQAVVAASVAGPALFVLLLALTVVLPAGSLPMGSWRRRSQIAIGLTVVMFAVSAFAPLLSGLYFVGSEAKASVPNPIAIAPGSSFWTAWQAASLTVILGAFAAGATSMVVRARRSTGIERLQSRWIVSALAAVTISVMIGAVTGEFVFAGVTEPLIPITIGIAVMRYRLYELDRIVSRTIVYALVSLFLVVVYAGSVLVLEGVFASIAQGNSLGVAASTLLVAALFQPARRRIGTAVDRRFDRARFDGERTAALFANRLRDEVDLARIAADLVSTVDLVVRPTVADIWMRHPSVSGH